MDMVLSSFQMQKSAARKSSRGALQHTNTTPKGGMERLRRAEYIFLAVGAILPFFSRKSYAPIQLSARKMTHLPAPLLFVKDIIP
jgi:hypothetical protein